MSSEEITFEQARKIAEEVAFDKLDWLREKAEIPLLREEYVEAEWCWVFFRNKELKGAPHNALMWGSAYAVSKKGTVRVIPDYSDEQEKLQEYIIKWSNHFKEKEYNQ